MEMTLVNCENYTKGLVCSILNEDGSKNKDKKLFFFEIDTHDKILFDKILNIYYENSLDVLFHKTKMGYHFISPTLILKDKWKEIHNSIKEINPRCPQICLRVEGNKYANEDLYFYKAGVRINSTPDKNVESICNFLNKIFDFEPRLKGTLKGDPVIVEYTPRIEIKE